MTNGVDEELLHPKKVGRIVSPAATNALEVWGTGGKEYVEGKKVVRFWVAIMELPSAQPVAFPDCN